MSERRLGVSLWWRPGGSDWAETSPTQECVRQIPRRLVEREGGEVGPGGTAERYVNW